MSEDQDIRGRAEQRIGSVLHGKYRLDAILGVGGMAVVYSATHRNQRKVAVKVLHPELSLRAEIRTRFLREGYAANAVEHDGVVAILDDDVDESGSAFLVMEQLHGLDVQAWCTRSGGRLPLEAALNVTHQLLEVLAVAHAKGVIHRDLKPANLFMQWGGRLKVLDFGIARVRERALGSEATRTGALLGTPAFMAPELASAQREEIDPRTDLWAVGATLFRLVSGEQVHPGEHANQVLIRAATTEARSVLSVYPELPSAVVELVGRALAFEKGARFQSALGMAASVKLAYEQLYGELCAESVAPLLVSIAALPQPVAVAPVAVGLVNGGAGTTAPEAGEASVAARALSEPQSPSVEPVSLRSPERSSRRRVAPLLGVAAALLSLGLAFDWYVSRASSRLRAVQTAARAVAVLPAPSAEVSLGAALPARPDPLLPAQLVASPVSEASASVQPQHSSPAPIPKRSTVRRASVMSSEPTAAPPRAAKNPLDVELQ